MNKSLHYLLNNMYRGLILLTVLIVCVLGMTSCIPYVKLLNQDKHFVTQRFNPDNLPHQPGYPNIKIISRKGEGTRENPRILRIVATIESFPDDIICEGEFRYFLGGEFGFDRPYWYTLEGVLHSRIVGKARYYLSNKGGPPSFKNKLVLLVLKRWIDEGKISLDDIANKSVVNSLEGLTEQQVELPDWLKDTGEIDYAKIQTIDLNPELPENAKSSVYVLHSDGILIKYLKDSESNNSEIQLLNQLKLDHNCNFMLENPIPKPTQ